MSDTIEVTQKSVAASTTTQIGIQYNGMTPEQAVKQTIDLFMENFPKLQALAKETAEKRVTEFCNNIIKILKDKQVTDFTPFTDPDVQFVLYEAQKSYARFGEAESMDILTELVVTRIQNDEGSHFKRVVDNAIGVACQLSSKQLDCISALFLLTKVRSSQINNIEGLRVFLKNVSTNFDLENLNFPQEISYLNFMGCLQLELPDIAEIQSNLYHLPLNEVDAVISNSVKQFNGDYGVSEIGIVLAIINAEKKGDYKLDPHIWIHN